MRGAAHREARDRRTRRWPGFRFPIVAPDRVSAAFPRVRRATTIHRGTPWRRTPTSRCVGEVPAQAAFERGTKRTGAVPRPVVRAMEPMSRERLTHAWMRVEVHLRGALHLLRRADKANFPLARFIELSRQFRVKLLVSTEIHVLQ